MPVLRKDPDAVLDYKFDWSDWLAAGETITSHTLTADSGVTVDSSQRIAGTVVAMLSGGTLDAIAQVTCHVVTDQGREDDRTLTLKIKQR